MSETKLVYLSGRVDRDVRDALTVVLALSGHTVQSWLREKVEEELDTPSGQAVLAWIAQQHLP